MALTGIRNVFWYSPQLPDLERKHAGLERLMGTAMKERAKSLSERQARLSVPQLYAGQSVLVTGASGFMGRVLLEALLRCCPGLSHVYIILRAKKGVAAKDRLKGLTAVPLFDRLRAEQPGALDKVVVLPGDTMEPGLGLSPEHRALVQREVSFVYHFAASVRFDEPFQKAVFVNLRSARDVVDLARGMPRLRALVHVSTAFTNTNRYAPEELVYQPEHDWRDVVRWAERLSAEDLAAVDHLGPKFRGFQHNTYVFTKALAEKLMDEASRHLPIIVTRPSIVTPSSKDPIPGWIDNLTGVAGLWAAGMKGITRAEFVPPSRLDCVPVDCAIKTIILASWSRALGLRLCPGDGVDVVSACSGLDLANDHEEFAWMISDQGAGPLVPFPGAVRTPKSTLTGCWVWYQMQFWYHNVLFGAILDLLAMATGTKPRALKIFRLMVVAYEALRPFWGPFDFSNRNMSKLQGLMHPEDEANFGLDALLEDFASIESYRTRVGAASFRGVLVYALKERDDPVRNGAAMTRIRWVMRLYHLVMAAAFFMLVVGLFKLKSACRPARDERSFWDDMLRRGSRISV